MRNGSGIHPHACVFVDLNTQRAFFDDDGSCSVLDGVQLCQNLRRVMAWIKRNQAPVVSSLDMHYTCAEGQSPRQRREAELDKGRMKLGYTVLPNRVYIAGDNTLAVSIDLFDKHQQVVFPQRSTDLFANPKADRFMTQIKTEEYFIFGAIAEHEVKAVALGLLVRHQRVTVIEDACGTWNHTEAELSMRQMVAKGANMTTVDELLKRKLARQWRYTSDNLIRSFRSNGVPQSIYTNGNAITINAIPAPTNGNDTHTNGNGLSANALPAPVHGNGSANHHCTSSDENGHTTHREVLHANGHGVTVNGNGVTETRNGAISTGNGVIPNENGVLSNGDGAAQMESAAPIESNITPSDNA